MRREFAVLFPVALIAVVCCASIGHCGYIMDSSWHPESSRFWYIIEVESGTPPPFRDLHVETADPYPGHYELAKAPPGWQMSIVPKGDGTGHAWISFYGDEPCSSAFFRVTYSGSFNIWMRPWLVTDDGDEYPDTGVIPGEGGADAYAPSVTGGNAAMKVGVHVMPHEDRLCSTGRPVLTTCDDIVATCGDNDVDFFPVFFDLSEYTCMEYSVEWPGTYSCAFTGCSYSRIGNIVWPAGTVPVEDATDWIIQCYAECMPGPIAIPGWGWIYEPGPATVRIVPSTQSGFLRVANCTDFTAQPLCNFAAGIGGAIGEVPCGPSRAEPSTWGAIKAMFK